MFRTVTLRGQAASMAWGYHTAAVLRQWVIVKNEHGRWSLSANIDRADRFLVQQRPLYLRATPRSGGFVTFPVQTVTITNERLTAALGPPEG